MINSLIGKQVSFNYSTDKNRTISGICTNEMRFSIEVNGKWYSKFNITSWYLGSD